MRLLVMVAAALILSAPVAVAQDRTQTLADIRQELSILFVELQRLRGELNTTSGATGIGTAGSTLSRMDALEAELRRLTSLTETLDLRVNQVVTDGTNRVGDLEFRLCELEDDCDIASLGETPSLGGVAVSGAAAAPASTGTSGGPALALSEQADFDRAQAALDAADYAQAAQLFETFTNTYSGGPLSAEAHFLRGQAEAAQGAWNRAARAYLDAFSGDPNAPRAPQALVNLGTSLGNLGQRDEACLTLSEVEGRYPGNPAVTQARDEMSRLGCS
jgi:tol-pal system protein YbgF